MTKPIPELERQLKTECQAALAKGNIRLVFGCFGTEDTNQRCLISACCPDLVSNEDSSFGVAAAHFGITEEQLWAITMGFDMKEGIPTPEMGDYNEYVELGRRLRQELKPVDVLDLAEEPA